MNRLIRQAAASSTAAGTVPRIPSLGACGAVRSGPCELEGEHLGEERWKDGRRAHRRDREGSPGSRARPHGAQRAGGRDHARDSRIRDHLHRVFRRLTVRPPQEDPAGGVRREHRGVGQLSRAPPAEIAYRKARRAAAGTSALTSRRPCRHGVVSSRLHRFRTASGLRRRVHPLFCERRLSPHAQAVTPLIAFRGFLTLSLDRGRIFI